MGLRHSIPRKQVEELLKILKEFEIHLPKTREGLIPKTSQERLEIRNVPNGQYIHFGIEKAIQILFQANNH